MCNDDKTINVNLIIDIHGQMRLESVREKMFDILISVSSYDSLLLVSAL